MAEPWEEGYSNGDDKWSPEKTRWRVVSLEARLRQIHNASEGTAQAVVGFRSELKDIRDELKEIRDRVTEAIVVLNILRYSVFGMISAIVLGFLYGLLRGLIPTGVSP